MIPTFPEWPTGHELCIRGHEADRFTRSLRRSSKTRAKHAEQKNVRVTAQGHPRAGAERNEEWRMPAMDAEDWNDAAGDDEAAFIWLQAAVQEILDHQPAPKPPRQDDGTVALDPADTR
jgi:hypothetical protein